MEFEESRLLNLRRLRSSRYLLQSIAGTNVRKRKSAQRGSFRPDVPPDIRPVRPCKAWKHKHFGMDMPRGCQRKIVGRKHFGLIFRSLKWEVHCSTNRRRTAVQIGCALRRFLLFKAWKPARHSVTNGGGGYCSRNWRCIAVLDFLNSAQYEHGRSRHEQERHS